MMIALAVGVTFAVILLVLNLGSGEKKIKHEIAPLYAVEDPQFLRSMGSLLGPAIVGGNKVTTLLNGDEIFPAMLEAIRSARKTITFETYIYWSGAIGEEFAEALSERARAGVKVHVLLDWLGSKQGEEGIHRQDEGGGRRGGQVPPAALVQLPAGQQPDPPEDPRRGREGRFHGRRGDRRQVVRPRAGPGALARLALPPRGAGRRPDAGGVHGQLDQDAIQGSSRGGVLSGADPGTAPPWRRCSRALPGRAAKASGSCTCCRSPPRGDVS